MVWQRQKVEVVVKSISKLCQILWYETLTCSSEVSSTETMHCSVCMYIMLISSFVMFLGGWKFIFYFV